MDNNSSPKEQNLQIEIANYSNRQISGAIGNKKFNYIQTDRNKPIENLELSN